MALLERDHCLRRRFAIVTGLSESQALSLLCFLLGLHDLGKLAYTFQNQRPDIVSLIGGEPGADVGSTGHVDPGWLLWREVVAPHLGKANPEADPDDLQDLLAPLARAVLGHHGRPPSEGRSPHLKDHFDQKALGAATAWADKMAELSGLSLTELAGLDYRQFHKRFQRTSWILAGLTVLCDWLGSDEGRFGYCPDQRPVDEYWWDVALPRAEDVLEASGVKPLSISTPVGAGLFLRPQVSPTPLQEHVSTCSLGDGPQLLIIEDVTGSGKTEAALALAHRLMANGLAQGVYVALPTMATSNAMFQRLGGQYHKLFADQSAASIVLAHGGRHLSRHFLEAMSRGASAEAAVEAESAAAQCAPWLADNRKKALLAPVGVGTIDQALLGILPAKHQSLRLLGLCRNVLIVDEVHACDAYMHRLLRALLRFQAGLGGSAVLLSATLPLSVRQELVRAFAEGLGRPADEVQSNDYPLLTCFGQSGLEETGLSPWPMARREVEVELIDEEDQALAVLARAAQSGACACWVRNTVADAVEAYGWMTERLGPDRVSLFHARFPMGRRLGIEDVCLTRFGRDSKPEGRSGQVLVATQVVEQSLDLDFDVMVTDLAPMDLIIQRAGRLHRHQDRQRPGFEQPQLFVLSPGPDDDPTATWYRSIFPKAAYVYPRHGRLWLTARQLAERGRLVSPEDIRELINSVYREEAVEQLPEELAAIERKEDGRESSEASLGDLNALNWATGYRDAGLSDWLPDTVTPTRLGDAQTDVRLARWKGGRLQPWLGTGDDAAWDMSQVGLRGKLTEIEWLPHLSEAVERAKQFMPDRGRWSVLVVLEPEGDGIWRGEVIAEDGKAAAVICDSDTGVRLERDRDKRGT